MRAAGLPQHGPRIWRRTTAAGQLPIEAPDLVGQDFTTEGPRATAAVPRTGSLPYLWALFSFVFAAQFVVGMWLNAQGFLWNDAVSRASNALVALHSAEPRLANVGLVWMPLPTLVEFAWVIQYPTWPAVVSSGFASTITTAIAGGATAALLLYAARRLGLPEWLGWGYALLVATNPMLFLYAGNGMSEGVAAPFLVGAVAFVVLFWRSGHRRYVTGGGLALALGFASLYEAVPYGAALFAALVLGTPWGSTESTVPTPGRRRRYVAGTGVLFLAPSLCVAALWVWANAVFAGDPLFFATSASSNFGYTAAAGTGLEHLKGDIPGSLGYVAARTAPFLVPAAFLILLRTLDGRFWRTNTFSLAFLLASVPLGLIAPLLYLGASFGWLRLFIYPLFVAAGWGLYEVASSLRPRRAAGLVLLGWVVAAPVVFWAMADPELGHEEHYQARAIVAGNDAAEMGFDTGTGSIERTTPVSRYLDGLPEDDRVALDTAAWSIAAQVSPSRLKNIILIQDSRFRDAIADPAAHNVAYLLVPNPATAPADRIVQRWPALWSGGSTGFALVESFPETPQEWRLYKVGR